MNNWNFKDCSKETPVETYFGDGTPRRFQPVWVKLKVKTAPNTIVARTYYDHERGEFCKSYNIEGKVREYQETTCDVIAWAER